MPKSITTIVFVLLTFLPIFLYCQLHSPPASPAAAVQQQIGLTNTIITYHRPSLKGRKIFGELLPYEEVWRTGANESTKIFFDRPVIIEGTNIPTGTYAIYTIPGESSWQIILNSDTALWGSNGFSASKNVVSYEANVEELVKRVNTMEIRWMNISYTSADLTIEWENVRVRLPIQFRTREQMEDNINNSLANSTNGNDYYKAARYYLDNNLDLEKAKKWIEKKLELDGEHHGYLHYHALIEYKLGNTDIAIERMEKALTLAKEADNPHYIRMNEQLLREWNIRATDMEASDLLEKSIAYHDPSNLWESGKFLFHFYESRPGTYQLTDVTIDNQSGSFELRQIKKQHRILRSLGGPGGCRHEFNGSEIISEEVTDRFRLNCNRTAMFKNYYSYLWGLPMKLRDEGTIIDSTVRLRHFFGQDFYELKVSYEPKVGRDTWYFYFDQQTFALRGYRFYHNERDNDGEYILLSGEATVDGLKIPRKRAWFTHKDRRYLGTDEIIDR